MNAVATTVSTAYASITLTHQVVPAQVPAAKICLEFLLLDLAAHESSVRDTANFATDSGKKFQETGSRVPLNPVLGNDFWSYPQVANISAKDLLAIADYRNNPHVFPSYFENAPPIPITTDVPFLRSTQDL